MMAIVTPPQPSSALVELERTVSFSKAVIYEAIVGTVDELEPEIMKTPSLDKIKPNQSHGHRRSRSEAPRPSQTDRLREYARVASTRAKAFVSESKQPYNALSVQGKFAHDYVEPFSTWSGRNKRVIMSQCLSTVSVQEANGSPTRMVNAASQNYTGFYETTPRSEELQRIALERLPVVDSAAVPLLAKAVDDAISSFFNADFCISSATGYGSNYISLPAITNKKTLVLLDENCHDSLLTGTYLAQPGRIVKFPHNDSKKLEEILKETAGEFERTILVIQGLYSMESDIPPLNDIRRLKAAYSFVVFCDEAHSFYSIGSTGRGCLQYWNEEHPETLVPEDLIDIRTATFSKAVGGVGGFVCGKSEFEQPIRERAQQLECEGFETLATSQMIQVLWVHGQPTRTARHLRRLADMSRFCRIELERFGIHVYGDDGTHILPVHVGRLTLAAKLSYILRGKGLLAVPVSSPAVPYWQSRIRLNLSSSHADTEVDQLLDAVIAGCKEIGVCKKLSITRRKYQPPLRHDAHYLEEMEASKTFESVFDLINQAASEFAGKEGLVSATSPSTQDPSTIQRGHNSRATYGLGSGGSRWLLTFPQHLAVECLLARRTAMEACMTFPDSSIGVTSTVAALSRPLLGYEKHYMLVPDDAPQAVKNGMIIASKQARPESLIYQDSAELHKFLQSHSQNQKTYFTVYIHVPDPAPSRYLSAALSKLCKDKPWTTGMTVLIDSPTCIPQAVELERFARLSDVQILVYGSFYKTLGLPGGFLAGSEILINELRYTNCGYMFTTSCQPFIMEMVRARLEKKFQVSTSKW